MNEKTRIDRLREVLIQACDKHIQEGGELVAGTFTWDGACCPIECAVGSQIHQGSVVNYLAALENLLGFSITDKAMWDFIDGFDNPNDLETRDLLGRTTDEFRLGRELRQKYAKNLK